MDIKFLEQFYEKVILPQYNSTVFDNVTWIDHGAIELDSFAHYFKTENKTEYVLVFEDFPGNVAFDDELSHDTVLVDDEETIRFGGDPPFKYIENITGYFTLYKEKDKKRALAS